MDKVIYCMGWHVIRYEEIHQCTGWHHKLSQLTHSPANNDDDDDGNNNFLLYMLNRATD